MARLFRLRPRRRKIRDYWYAVFYDPDTRKRRAVSLGTQYDDVAEKRFLRLLEQYEAGEYDPFRSGRLEFRSLTFAEAVKRFNADNDKRVRLGELSPTTAKDYRRFMKMVVDSLPAGYLLNHYETEDAREFIFGPKRVMTKGRRRVVVGERSVHSYAGYYVRLNRFFRWCLERRYVLRSPMDGIKKPKPGRAAPDFLRRHEVEALIRAIEHDYRYKLSVGQAFDGDVVWLCDVVRIAVGTGMRPSELARLRWIDVDRRNGFLYVRSGIQHRGRRTTTKNRHDRTIPIFPDVADVLDRLHDQRRDEDASKPVLTTPAGSLSVDKTSRKVKRYMRAAGLPESYDYYTLRHTFASWLRLAGVSLDRIKEWMGHATIEQTLAYAHIVPESIRSEGDPVFPVLFS